MPDETGESVEHCKVLDDGQLQPCPSAIECMPPLRIAANVSSWGSSPYLAELIQLAEEFGLDPQAAAQKFGVLELPDQRMDLHEGLGYRRHR